PPITAAALCSPTSTCFACRTGRRPTAAPLAAAHRPGRRRRVAARRASVRRTLILTTAGVGIGRLVTAAVATGLGGVAFPGVPGLLRIAAVAAVSAPFGPPVFAVVRRLPSNGRGAGYR